MSAARPDDAHLLTVRDIIFKNQRQLAAWDRTRLPDDIDATVVAAFDDPAGRSTQEIWHDVITTHLKDAYTQSPSTLDAAARRLASIATHETDYALMSMNARTAVNHAIADRGMTVQPGGDWCWGDSLDVTSRTRSLAAELGTAFGAHSGTPALNATRKAGQDIEAAYEGRRFV